MNKKTIPSKKVIIIVVFLLISTSLFLGATTLKLEKSSGEEINVGLNHSISGSGGKVGPGDSFNVTLRAEAPVELEDARLIDYFNSSMKVLDSSGGKVLPHNLTKKKIVWEIGDLQKGENITRKYRLRAPLSNKFRVTYRFKAELESESHSFKGKSFNLVDAQSDYKIMVWTNRKVYDDNAYNMEDNTLFDSGDNDANENVVVYAAVLNEDGKLVTTDLNFSGSLMDQQLWDHYGYPNDTNQHHKIYNITGSHNWSIDINSLSDGNNDGIYNTTVINGMDIESHVSGITEEHFLINITIKENTRGINESTHVLFTRMACHHGSRPGGGGATVTESSAHGEHVGDGSQATPCVMCHWGYEHTFGEGLPDWRNGAYEEGMLGGNAHTGVTGWNPIDHTGTTQNSTYNNMTGLESGGLASSSYPWSVVSPGSDYCFSCHYNQSNGHWLDYYNTSSSSFNVSERPSCSQPNSTAGGLRCHAKTDITNSPLEESNTDWYWKKNGSSGTFDHSYTANSSAGNGVPCEVCHVNWHNPKLPNMSVLGSKKYYNLKYQCFPCHNASDYEISGITHWWGEDKCSTCHVNQTGSANPHLVPNGVNGGPNCTRCHKKHPKYTPYEVNVSIMNFTNYIHHELNNQSSTSNATMSVPWQTRMCWACHGNVSWQNNTANLSMQPNHHYLGENWKSEGPYYATREANCTQCHKEPLNFSAPLNKGHTWYAKNITTPAIDWCTDCHAQKKFRPNLFYKNNSATPLTKNSTVAHYGKKHNTWAEKKLNNESYCQVCHMNASTPIPFAEQRDKTRPYHSVYQKVYCTNSSCHRGGRLHSDKHVKPTFTNQSCQQLGCHSDHNFHNGSVTCFDCHHKKSEFIHPIRFITTTIKNQSTGKGTKASCRNCHDQRIANATLVNEVVSGKRPLQVPGSHGGKPQNGSLWIRNDTTYKGNKSDYPQNLQNSWDEIFWEFNPESFQMVSSYNKEYGTISDFENMTSPSRIHTKISEVSIGGFVGYYPNTTGYNEPTYPYNQNFTKNTGNWTNTSYGTDPSYMENGWTNLSGGVIYSKITQEGSAKANWNVTFYYNKTDPPAIASTLKSFGYMVDGVDETGESWKFKINITDPNGNKVSIYQTGPHDYSTSWQSLEEIEIDNSTFSEKGWYNISIQLALTGASGGGWGGGRRSTTTYSAPTIYFDNVRLEVDQADEFIYNYTFTIDNISLRQQEQLQLGYWVGVEEAGLYAKNYTSSGYDRIATLWRRGPWPVSYNLTKDYIQNGVAKVRVNTSIDYYKDDIYFSYMLMFGDNNTKYPCEYCHHPNKHYKKALGHVLKFNGDNQPSQKINSSSTWCASCHYDEYEGNTTEGYKDMLNTFESMGYPVPPEISGNNTYGNYTQNINGSDYINHEAQGWISSTNYNDDLCDDCHYSGEANTSKQFIHHRRKGIVVQEGGKDCIGCHDVNESEPKVNVSIMNQTLSIHKNINNINSSTLDDMCWGCHGDDKNGDDIYNASEQGSSGHPGNYSTPRTCPSCHHNSSWNPSGAVDAPQTIEHIPNNTANSSTEIYTNNSCVDCHNLTEMKYNHSSDPNGIKNAYDAVSHYGKKRTDIVINDVVNCNYCHQNTSTNFNLTERHRRMGNHSSYTKVSCTNQSCHGKGRMHNSTLQKPNYSPPETSYCSNCHTTSKKHPSIQGSWNCTDCHTAKKGDIHRIEGSQNYSLTASGETYGLWQTWENAYNQTYPNSNIANETCEACHAGANQPNGVHTLNLTYQAKNTSVYTYFGWSGSGLNCTTCHSSQTSNGKQELHSAHPKTYNSSYSSCACHNGLLANIPKGTSTGTYQVDVFGKTKTYDASKTQSCGQCHGNWHSQSNYNSSLYPGLSGNFSWTLRTDQGLNASFSKRYGPLTPVSSENSLGVNGYSNCTGCHKKDIHKLKYKATTGNSYNGNPCDACHSTNLANNHQGLLTKLYPKDETYEVCDMCHYEQINKPIYYYRK